MNDINRMFTVRIIHIKKYIKYFGDEIDVCVRFDVKLSLDVWSD